MRRRASPPSWASAHRAGPESRPVQPVSPRFARTVPIPLRRADFLRGSAARLHRVFSSERTFIDALISWLQSPGANPHGYLFATAGTAVSGILLAPVAVMFYRRLSAMHRTLAAIGSLFLAAGLVGLSSSAASPRFRGPMSRSTSRWPTRRSSASPPAWQSVWLLRRCP
jgi:hypothetical protein